VVALDEADESVISYGVTDYEGGFTLKLTQGETYLLRVSFIGFHTFEEKITAQENVPMKVVLMPSLEQMQAMEIVEELPVTISGDTIIYQAEAFTNGTERKLEDVLEALPGFEVNEYGEVKVQGKDVEKILVEGKEFFEGDTKLAVQNIPANAVDKVQLLRNFNDISPLGNLEDDDDRLAINIRLADDKKNLFFGDVELGAGLDERYLGHANLFKYKPKSTYNFIADANNIGRQAFTSRDYFRFSGGMNSISSGSGAVMNLSTNDMGFMELQNNSALNINTGLGAFNFNWVPNKRWKFSGFAIGSYTENTIQSNNDRLYVRASENNVESLSELEDRSNLSVLAKAKATYTKGADLHISYEVFSKASDLASDRFIDSDFLGVASQIINPASQHPWQLDQKLAGYWALDAKNILSLEASYSYQVQDPRLSLRSTGLLFDGFLPLEQLEQDALVQTTGINTHQQQSELNWYHILNPRNHLNFRIGNNYNHQNLLSDLSQETNPQLEDEVYGNDVGYVYSDLYAGVNYRTRMGKLTVNPGINFHQFILEDSQLTTTRTNKKYLWLPELALDFQISNAANIRMFYTLQANFPDIQSLAQGLRVQNYNTIFRGNRSLKNGIYHNLSLNYFNYSLFNHISIFGGVNYQKRKDDFTQELAYQNLSRLLLPINSAITNEVASGYVNVEKTYTTFKISGDLNLSYSNINNTFEGQANINQTFAQQADLSGEAKFFKRLTLRAGYRLTLNQYESNLNRNQYRNHQPYGKAQLKLLKNCILALDYEWHDYRSKHGSLQSQFDFLNASLEYQPEKSPWLLSVRALNLLDTRTIRRDSFVENQVNTFSYWVQPRYFMLSVQYDI